MFTIVILYKLQQTNTNRLQEATKKRKIIFVVIKMIFIIIKKEKVHICNLIQ